MEKHNAEQIPVTRLADISMTSNHGVSLLLKPYQCTPSGGNRKLALPRNPEEDLDDAHADARRSLSTRKSKVTVAPAVAVSSVMKLHSPAERYPRHATPRIERFHYLSAF